MQKAKESLNSMQIIGGVVITILSFVAMFGVALYWLVDQATKGNQAATMLLTFIVIVVIIFVVLVVILALVFGISKIQQSAARSNMELMKVNAIENQQIMNDIQKGLLLQAQTQRQQNNADMTGARLVEVLTRLRPGQNSGESRYLNTGSNIIDNAFEDLNNE